MAGQRMQLGLFFGGQSAEHDVSLVSAKCILAAMDRSLYDPFLIGVSREGLWYHVDEALLMKTRFDQPISFVKKGTEIFLTATADGPWIMECETGRKVKKLDMAFPIIHGPSGEDGTLQALFRLTHLPFVGCDVGASALCMDKEWTKRILSSHQVPIAKFFVQHVHESVEGLWEKARGELGIPMYVKPANLGSSVGVSKVMDKDQFEKALQLAFQYDEKALIEENIDGYEVEVAVLGNWNPKASTPGRFRANDEFYTYDAKYLNDQGATFHIPAVEDKDLQKRIQELALKTYQALDCRGLARVDLFLTPHEDLIVNEVNTLPGFTPISMYPKLWLESGLPYSKLIDQLVDYGKEHFLKFHNRGLKRS